MYRDKFIRLWPRGYKNYTHFLIVVCYGNTRSRTFIIEKLGFYNPNFKERRVEINVERMAYGMNNGAKIHKSVVRAIGSMTYLK